MTLVMDLQNLKQEKWYIINDQNNLEYGEGNKDKSNINNETKIIKSSLRGYSDTYIFIVGYMTATGDHENTNVAFKNCAPLQDA